MQRSKIALGLASAIAAHQESAMAVTCTANSDATLRNCIRNSVDGDIFIG